jgi:hypothetical protein
MNLPIENRLIDRLVDGELPEAERRELLLLFDTEPDGWRRCALAFLEAQTWRQALTPVVAASGVGRLESSKGVSSGFSTPFASGSGRATRFWRPAARLSGLAAAIVLAFTLGWFLHRQPGAVLPDSRSVGPQVESVVERSAQPPQNGSIKVARKDSNSTQPVRVAADVDPLAKDLQKLQQQGYRVETQPRLVSLESKDGRKLKLPVQEVRIRYIGDRIY